jgi:hypothetical protein
LEVCEGNPIQIGFKSNISGGTGSGIYTYEWLPAAGLDDNTLANPTVLNPQATTEYSVLVTEMFNNQPTGIIAEEKVMLTVLPKPEAVVDTGYAVEICSGNEAVYSTNSEVGVLMLWRVENGSPVGAPPFSGKSNP